MKNSLVFTRVVCLVILSLNVKAQVRDAGEGISKNIRVEIQQNVNWIFELDDMPDVKKAATPVILVTLGGEYNSVRGLTGGKSCGSIAATYALLGYQDACISWLNAAQSHNSRAMELFNTYPAYAMEKASEHRKEALEYGVQGPYGTMIRALYERLSK